MTKYLIVAGVVFSLCSGFYLYGDRNGAARIQARWDAAEVKALNKGIDARTEAEKEIANETPPSVAEPKAPYTGSPASKPCRVPDRYNRDCH